MATEILSLAIRKKALAIRLLHVTIKENNEWYHHQNPLGTSGSPVVPSLRRKQGLGCMQLVSVAAGNTVPHYVGSNHSYPRMCTPWRCKSLQGARINIPSDSQAAIRALKSTLITSNINERILTDFMCTCVLTRLH